VVERVGERYREALVTRIRETVTVEAPPDDVWNVISDPRNLPRWNKHILAVHDVPEEGLTTGTRYWTEIGGAGVRFRVRADVQELRPPRYARIKLTGPLDAVVQTWVHPAGRNRSVLEQEVDYHIRGGPLGELIGGALRMFGATTLLRRGVRAQKRQAEAG
jgi:ligand-binding SRPBCC domain-containing protein